MCAPNTTSITSISHNAVSVSLCIRVVYLSLLLSCGVGHSHIIGLAKAVKRKFLFLFDFFRLNKFLLRVFVLNYRKPWKSDKNTHSFETTSLLMMMMMRLLALVNRNKSSCRQCRYMMAKN